MEAAMREQLKNTVASMIAAIQIYRRADIVLP
jgi:hypothetical protein